jgi:hypothetical protein
VFRVNVHVRKHYLEAEIRQKSLYMSTVLGRELYGQVRRYI